MNVIRVTAIAWAILYAPCLYGQWNPAAGQWGKSDANDVRVMTYNIEDGICSTAVKTEGATSWCALSRIVAALKPDVLILQEAGDNDGNGTGPTQDSAAQLLAALEQFIHGGSGVTAYVQKYDAAYDLPYIFVSVASDGFNRNVIMSRHPFADLNGDTRAGISDIGSITAHLYAPGGTGGIRGFMFAEVNLPDATYAGNLVVGNAHLKSGSAGGDLSQRLVASQNVAYFIDHWYNGAGLGSPDPFAKIADSPAASSVLNANTAIVIGGDWNEDELTNGRKGPAEWLTQAQTGGPSDGTDRDRGDMAYDDARNVFTNARNTFIGSSAKFDYLAWQDSIVTLRRSFLFYSVGMSGGAFPSEMIGYPTLATISSTASDHLPVVVDLILAGVCIAPAITSHPASQSVCAGGSVTFTVTATGVPTPNFQWRKNSVNIGGATSSSYTVNPVSAGDAGNYDCVATNDCGTATSNTATLTVNVGPSISAHPVNQSVTAGDPVSFSVTASGTAPLSYQWRKGGSNLANGGAISGATTATLTINPTVVSDAGTYDCVVTNGCGSVDSNDATLTVNAPCNPCDTDCNGTINPFDIQPFLDLLGHLPSPCSPCAGDADGNGTVNPFDINAFLDCL